MRVRWTIAGLTLLAVAWELLGPAQPEPGAGVDGSAMPVVHSLVSPARIPLASAPALPPLALRDSQRRDPSSERAVSAESPTAAAQSDPRQAWAHALAESAPRPLVANLELRGAAPRALEFDPRELDALRDLIDANGLSEASSAHDLDDGDGRFEPWELGFQLWERGHLVLFALGPDPYSSYGYALRALPESVAAFERLELLDLGGSRLEQLPDALGRLSQLRELRLAHNQLRALPESLGDLLRLERLVLGANRVEALPRSLRGLERLEELWLADNPLAELPAELLELPALRRLDVSQSLGAAGLPAERGLRALPDLSRAARLETLYVAGNRLCGEAASLAAFDTGNPALRGLGLQRCGG